MVRGIKNRANSQSCRAKNISVKKRINSNQKNPKLRDNAFPTIRPEVSSKLSSERIKRVQKMDKKEVLPVCSIKKFQNEKRITKSHLYSEK